MSAKKADPPNMLPIVRLVREAIDGRPLRPFAEDRGISYSTLRVYNNPHLKPLKAPLREHTMKQLANGLDLPLSVVQRAADASVGRVYRQSASDAAGNVVQMVSASLRGLDPEALARTKAELQRLIDELP